ncbi:hypothetical protein HDV03_001291 [Kappamyces sp. JEL0829]|nr:hypothetical protein HDV03_001291 [Kappamyces sp. JEL0829]
MSHWQYRLSQNQKQKSLANPFVSSSSIESIIKHVKANTASNTVARSTKSISRPVTTSGQSKILTKDGKTRFANIGVVSSAQDQEPAADDKKSRVRFYEASGSDPEKAYGVAHNDRSVLTEEALKRHTEYMKLTHPVSLIDRVTEWVRSIPLFLDDPEHEQTADRPASHQRPKTTLPRGSTTPNLFGSMDVATAKKLERPKSQMQNRSLPTLGEQPMASPLFVRSWSSKEKLVQVGKQKEPALLADGKKSQSPGKLICCLKVEIKSGVYKMLPVHQVGRRH